MTDGEITNIWQLVNAAFDLAQWVVITLIARSAYKAKSGDSK